MKQIQTTISHSGTKKVGNLRKLDAPLVFFILFLGVKKVHGASISILIAGKSVLPLTIVT